MGIRASLMIPSLPWRSALEADLISAIAIHFLAGLVAGSIFAVRTLLILVGFVLIGCVGVTILRGVSTGVLWSVGSLVAVQAGYLGGVYVRSFLEHVGIAVPQAQPRRPS
jgi:hypothetical protein